MCTYSISIKDSIVDTIRPSFKDDNAIQEWMQQQIESLVAKFVLDKKTETMQPVAETKDSVYQHDILCGIFSKDSDLESLRESYIEEKYGL